MLATDLSAQEALRLTADRVIEIGVNSTIPPDCGAVAYNAPLGSELNARLALRARGRENDPLPALRGRFDAVRCLAVDMLQLGYAIRALIVTSSCLEALAMSDERTLSFRPVPPMRGSDPFVATSTEAESYFFYAFPQIPALAVAS